MVDAARGELRYAPNCAGTMRPVAVGFGLPVIVENNANAGAVGEYYFGAARNVAHFLYLGGGTGIGGGMIMDGRIFRGRGGFAGEIGHMTIEAEGELCSCGRRGCWETLAGPRAVVAKYRSRMEPSVGGGVRLDDDEIGFAQLVEAAGLGDLAALAVLQDAARYLGIGIANLLYLFNPHMNVLGCSVIRRGLGAGGDLLGPIIKETVKQNSLFPMRAALSIVPSLNGADDCVMGAAALALDSILRQPV